MKLEWGAKRSCLNCGTRFYDLQKTSVSCPKCGTTFELYAVSTRKRGKAAPVDLTKDLLLDDVTTDIELDADLSADLIEDTDELAGDLEDMPDGLSEDD